MRAAHARSIADFEFARVKDVGRHRIALAIERRLPAIATQRLQTRIAEAVVTRLTHDLHRADAAVSCNAHAQRRRAGDTLSASAWRIVLLEQRIHSRRRYRLARQRC